MFSSFLPLVIYVFSVFFLFSSGLPSSPNQISSSLDQPAVFETLATNSTSLQDLASPVLSYSPDCSISYGRNLDHASCTNALAKISQVTTPMIFGERGTGTWDVILPHRYLSDDGQCAIDVKVAPSGAQQDESNYLQITEAASAVLRACVDGRQPSIGGLVKQLGVKYRSLFVEMSRYFSPADCHTEITSTPPSYDSCQEIIDTMQWSKTLTKFGFPWQPGVEVRLPYFSISADTQCKMLVANKISVAPILEVTTWANIWAGAVAVNEMCVKDGKSGSAKPQSFHGNLVLFLFGRGSDPPPEILSSLNMSSSDLSMLSTFNTTPSATIV